MQSGLAGVFSPQLIFTVEGDTTRDALFALIAEKMAAAGVVADDAKAGLVARLIEREQTASTAIGKGLALPHVVVPGIKNIIGVLVRVPDGVDWEAIDNEKVRLVVLLFAGETETGERVPEYLETLAEVASILSDEECRNQIAGSKKAQDVHRILARAGEQEGPLTRYRRLIWFAAGAIITCLASLLFLSSTTLPPGSDEMAKFNTPEWITRQVLTTTLFFSMVLGTLLFFEYRVAIGAIALGALLLVGVEDVEAATKAMSLATILFIMGTMVIVRWLENKGFFRYIVLAALRQFGGSPYLLTGALILFSSILAGLVDEVSAILVVFPIGIEMARIRKTSVIPYLLSLVFATNVGSALTLIGNPIGIYLAFAAKLTFADFLRNATPIAMGVSLLLVPAIVFHYRRYYRGSDKVDVGQIASHEESEDSGSLLAPSVIFALFVTLIVCHSLIEDMLSLPKQTTLIVAPLVTVGIIVFLEREKGRSLVERAPDWWTILYFMFLFATASCLEASGVTAKFAHCILRAADALPLKDFGEWGRTANALLIILWGSAILSGFIDNLPIVAALVPVVKTLCDSNLPGSHLLWWALLFGGCFGGNLTMIGSTANLVAIGMYEKQFRAKFRFKDWIGPGIVVTFGSLVIATACLLFALWKSR